MGTTADLLRSLIRCASLIGFLATIFGPPSSTLLLRLLYSTKWSQTQAPVVLACYCPYIAIMALNGTTEAFVHAVLDEKGMQTSNVFMLVSAGVHLGVSGLLVKMTGATGLVLADAINMTTRIAFSLWCIREHFKSVGGFSVMSILPTRVSLLTGLTVCITLYATKTFIRTMHFPLQMAIYASVSIVCLGVMLWIMWKNEKGALNVLRALKKSDAVKTDKTE